MKNRMRENCTYGSVRGRDGNVPTYSELELDWLLDRQFCGLGAFEDTIDVNGRAPERVGCVYAIRHQATACDKATERVDRRQLMLSRERDNQLAMNFSYGAGQHNQPLVRSSCERFDCGSISTETFTWLAVKRTLNDGATAPIACHIAT